MVKKGLSPKRKIAFTRKATPKGKKSTFDEVCKELTKSLDIMSEKYGFEKVANAVLLISTNMEEMGMVEETRPPRRSSEKPRYIN